MEKIAFYWRAKYLIYIEAPIYTYCYYYVNTVKREKKVLVTRHHCLDVTLYPVSQRFIFDGVTAFSSPTSLLFVVWM